MKPLVHRKRKRVRRQPAPIQRLHVTKGDLVQVLSGDDRGKRGKVLRVYPRAGRVTVEGVNIITRHRRATANTEAGIVRHEGPIHHSKVMLVDPKTSTPTRVRRRKDADGTLERIGVRSGVPIPRSR